MEEKIQEILKVNLVALKKYSEALDNYKQEKEKEVLPLLSGGDPSEEVLDTYFEAQALNSLLLKETNYYFSIVYCYLKLLNNLELEISEENNELLMSLPPAMIENLKNKYTPNVVIDKNNQPVENVEGVVEAQKKIMYQIFNNRKNDGANDGANDVANDGAN